MRQSELIVLIIILTLLVIFIFYIKRLKQLERNKKLQFVGDEDECDNTVCPTEEFPCLTAWFYTFDQIFSDNTQTPTAVFQTVGVQSDGKTVVATKYAVVADNFVQRFNTDGTVDGTFTPPTFPVLWSSGQWKMIEFSSDGSIFIVGESTPTGTGERSMILLKLQPSGAFDLTFGSGGYWFDDLTVTTASEGHSLLLMDNGQILVGGMIREIANPNAATVARINADGTVDTTFGTSGFYWLNQSFSDYGEVHGLGIQTDGKIVAGGFFANLSGSIYGLGAMRLNANGTLDLTYNGGLGFIADNVDGLDGQGTSATFLNGEMFVGGWTFNSALNYNVQTIMKIKNDGTLDTAWGNDAGRFYDDPDPLTIVPSKYSQVNGVAPVCDGGIFVIGFTEPSLSANRKGFLYKLRANGTLDLTFGDGNGYALSTGFKDYRDLFQHQVTQLYVVGTTNATDSQVYKFDLTAF